MTPICALGLMSGTSMDGIDLAVLRSDGEGQVERGPSHFVSYDAGFRRRITAALEDAKAIRDRNERPGDLRPLERELTVRHVEAAREFLGRLAEGPWVPELIGFHGQTVLHRPEIGLTVQLGDGPLLARETGLRTVYDMRAADMREGGQGAPLVPAYHAALATSVPEALRDLWPKAFVNIGGISNVTYVPSQGDPVAFDCGPGNALIDQWVERHAGVPFDQGGAIAAEGGIDSDVVEAYLSSDFFGKPAPKSLDRADFTLDRADGLELADGARTLAAVSAGAILESRLQMPVPPRLWIICGGGRKNPHIMADLAEGAGEAMVVPAEEAGLDGDAMEAEAWAYLAIRAAGNLPLTFPTTTGCRRPVSGGVIVAPS